MPRHASTTIISFPTLRALSCRVCDAASEPSDYPFANFARLATPSVDQKPSSSSLSVETYVCKPFSYFKASAYNKKFDKLSEPKKE